MKRRASTFASALVAKKAKRTPSGKTYFDLLPFELLVCLLQGVPVQDKYGHHWPDDLMSLGRVSERNRAAVLEALRYKVDIYKCGTGFGSLSGLFDSFVQFFDKDLREVNLVSPNSICHGRTPTLRSLKQPITSLRKAKIVGKKAHLELIEGNKSLTHLDITLCRRFRMTWKSLVETLQSLTLTSLTLHISCKVRAPTVKTLARVAHSCQEVRELTFGHTRNADYTKYWGLIISLPHLEKLSISGKVFSSIFMNRLSQIRELKITGWLDIDNILPYESNIVHLRPIQTCSGNDIAKLRGFRKLRTLALEMKAGAEIEVPTTVYNLEALHLKWASDNLPPPHQLRIDADVYHHADVQAVIATVRNATQLRELALFCVYLSNDTIAQVIKIMGKNLRVLHTHLDFQKCHPGKRLEVILLALAAHCPRIEKLELFNPCQCISVTQKKKNRWLTAVRRARENCPDLDLTAVRFYLSSMIDRDLMNRR